MTKILRTLAELKDSYRTHKLQIGDHRGINAFAHAEKIGFDTGRVMFDRMSNRFGRELQAYVNETGTWCYNLADLLDDIKSSDFDSYEIDFIGKEWQDRNRCQDPKERNFDSVIFLKNKEDADVS